MASSLRPPYHHDAAKFFRRLAAAGLIGLAVAFLSGLAAEAADAPRLAAAEAQRLQSQERLIIVDIRRPDEWRATGLPAGAERATIRSRRGDKGFLQRIEEITGGDKATPIALICARGVRSRLAGRLLGDQGYTHVADIGEGMLGSVFGPGWVQAGLPLTPCPDC